MKPLLESETTSFEARQLLERAAPPSAIPPQVLQRGRLALRERSVATPPSRARWVLVLAAVCVSGLAVAGWGWSRHVAHDVSSGTAKLPAKIATPVRERSTETVAPSVPVAPTAFLVAPPRRVPIQTTDGSLDGELMALRSIRAALATEPARALAASRSYAERFPAGILGPEAKLLEVEALLRLGRRAEAERLGHSLLNSAGTSLYRARLESLLAPPSKP